MYIDEISCKEGDFLAIWLEGVIGLYIAEVVETDPLRVKVAESGSYSNLNRGSFKIRIAETKVLQQDIRKGTISFAIKYPLALCALNIMGPKESDFVAVNKENIKSLHDIFAGQEKKPNNI